jgi:hypothetical protein
MKNSWKNSNELLRSLGLVIGDPEHVLICTHESCGYALQAHGTRVSSHMWEKHQIPKASHRGLDRVVKPLKLYGPRSVAPRSNSSAPHLLQLCPCFTCWRCGYLTTSSKLHQQHQCWSNEFSNRIEEDQSQDLDEVIYLQSWTREGTRQYWKVKPEQQSLLAIASNASEPPDDLAVPGQGLSRLEQLCQAERTRLTEDLQTAKGDDLPDLTATSPWFHRTQWLET